MDADQLRDFQEGIKDIFREFFKDANELIRNRRAILETDGRSKGCTDTAAASSSSNSLVIYQPNNTIQPSSPVVNNIDTETISNNMVDDETLEGCEHAPAPLKSVRLVTSVSPIAHAFAAQELGPLPVLASLKLPNRLTAVLRYNVCTEEKPCHAANIQKAATLAFVPLVGAAPRLYDG